MTLYSEKPFTRLSALLVALAIILSVAACGPTDPQNDEIQYDLYNPSAQSIQVSWCDVECLGGEMVNADTIKAGTCLLVKVGKQESGQGSSYRVSTAAGSGFVNIAHPKGGYVYDVSQPRTSETAARSSPLAAEDHACS